MPNKNLDLEIYANVRWLPLDISTLLDVSSSLLGCFPPHESRDLHLDHFGVSHSLEVKLDKDPMWISFHLTNKEHRMPLVEFNQIYYFPIYESWKTPNCYNDGAF